MNHQADPVDAVRGSTPIAMLGGCTGALATGAALGAVALSHHSRDFSPVSHMVAMVTVTAPTMFTTRIVQDRLFTDLIWIDDLITSTFADVRAWKTWTESVADAGKDTRCRETPV